MSKFNLMIEPGSDIADATLINVVKKYPLISSLTYFNSIESTNAYASHEIRSNRITAGALIIADHQTNGKGRYGNGWSALPGKNILMSWVIKPMCAKNKWPSVTIPVAIALKHGISKLLPQADIQLKWPNDILINQKKCVGILANAEIKHKYIVIGIGINVNEPPSADRTSINNEALHQHDRWAVLDGCLDALMSAKLAIESADFKPDDWNQSAAYFGQNVQVMTNQLMTGIFKGINKKGAIILKTGKGQMEISNGQSFRPRG